MKFLNVVAATALLLSATVATAQPPKREMRSVWVAGMGIDWPRTSGTSASAQSTAKKEITTYLDNFKAQNFTGICLHVRPRADAYYKSTLEPWSGDVSGKRGTDPGWDPLAYVIEECHKRGMECYAWINPYRVNANSQTYTTDFDKQWYADGIIFRNNTWTVFNPGLPAARKHCLDVMKEIYTNYMVDGMLFDDYFYPGDVMPTNSSSADWDLYKSSGTTLGIGDWRRQNVNTFIKELYDDIQKTRPDMRFGIGPAGVSKKSASRYGLPQPNVSASDWMYDDIYCDPLAWMDDKSIDFIAPQIYWQQTHSTAPFGPLCKWWSDVADHFGIHNYVSIASYKVKDFGGTVAAGSKEIAAQVALTRQYTLNNAPGAIYYNANSINGPGITGLGDYLGANSYTRPALTPLVDWKKRTVYQAPAIGSYTSGTLKWTAAQAAPKAIIRYTVYAIPEDTDLAEAKAADGDGLDAAYLVDVAYGTQYTLPAAKQKNHWYAVCVYDGYGYESEPGIYGYSAEPSAKVTLVSPAQNARAAWQQQFKWSAADNATYRLQIAGDNTFATLFADKDAGSNNQLTVNFDGAAENTTMYWRVICTQAGRLSTASDSRAVVTPARTPAPVPVPQSPVNGQCFDTPTVQLTWTMPDTEGVTQYTVQVAAAGTAFATPLVNESIDATATTAYTLRTAALGEGDFEWRVIARGPRLTDGVSAPASFSLENLQSGQYENGYYIQKDPATYDVASTMSIKNLWMRSAHSPLSNMSFDSDGMMNRGMVATQTHVYLSGRETGSATSPIYLREFSAATGEHIRDIQLSEDGQVPYFPCNDVQKDSKGTICISNLSLNISTTPVYIHTVDPATGALTEAACLSGGSTQGRVDHVGIYGDVAGGNFTVIAAIANTATVVRWRVTGGKAGAIEKKTVKKFYPSTATTFGIAPKVFAISDDLFYADGGATAWTLYDFSNPSVMKGSFDNCPAAAPKFVSDNGAATFVLGDEKFGVYSAEPAGASGGSARFNIVKMGAKDDFSTITHLWQVPRGGLGTTESSTTSAPVAAVPISQTAAHVYVYSPGNGLSAYRVSTASDGVVDNIASGNTGAPDEYYNLQGVRVDSRNLAPGVYVHRKGNTATKVVVR